MPLQESQVTVTFAANIALVAANARRSMLVISNRGPNPIHIGSSAVALTNGAVVAAAGQLVIGVGSHGDAVKEAWYARAETAIQVAPADTHILEGIG